MIKLIGLLDYDALSQRKYSIPNYDLGVTYAYLSKDPNISVRLITSLANANLDKYDEIMIFKLSPYLGHPSRFIKNYYKYNIQEFGQGFINRPERPYLLETREIYPDFKCYNAIIRFSAEYPDSPSAWKFDFRLAKSNKYSIKLYEKVEGEFLRKDFPPPQCKNILIHDNVTDIFTHSNQLETLQHLLNDNYRIMYAQQLDISLLKDTNIIEQVLTKPKYASLRKNLYLSKVNDNYEWLIDYFTTHKCKKTSVSVRFEQGKNQNYYFTNFLRLNYYNAITYYTLRLKPYFDREVAYGSALTHYAYRFLFERPDKMSFYEYVFYLECGRLNLPHAMVHTDEATYGYILSKYGMTNVLKRLENWIIENPQYKKYVFIGGSSEYEEQRKSTYDPRRSKYAFREGADDSSEECGS